MISSYYYKGREVEDWDFEETELNNVNLIVGASGSGKTRYLNTIFNVSSSIVHGQPFRPGYWRLTVRTEEYEYLWEYDGVKIDGENQIKKEFVKRKRIDSQEEFEDLIDRTTDNFVFCGTKLPKLQRDRPGITLLKEEEKIGPLYETFSKVQIRKFHDEGLKDALSLQDVSKELIELSKSKDGILALWKQQPALSAKMFLLKEKFPKYYKLAVDTFEQVFPSIKECEVAILENPPISIQVKGVVPVFLIKEEKINRKFPLHELSSGMQKVLLIIADIITLPKGSIYIIDEYENSLGINAIDFLPDFLVDHGANIQFLVTTHHPYLINSMPMKTWRVFHRDGSKVSIKGGEEFEQKYGKSKQKAFIQLINDPFYSGNQLQ